MPNTETALSEIEKLLKLISDERAKKSPNQDIITNCLAGIGDNVHFLRTGERDEDVQARRRDEGSGGA